MVRTIDKRTPAQKLRAEWAKSLAAAMGEWIDPENLIEGMTPQRLKLELKKLGVDVSLQSVYAWLRTDDGGWSPRPHHQAAIARVLGLKARHIFVVEDAA